MNKLTVLIITFNEEAHIAACIDSVQMIGDEVLVIDSGSSDQTREIARSKGARVITNTFPGFGQQKNFGTKQASNDLIFSIDADEILSSELAEEISLVKKELNNSVAYSCNRTNMIGSREIKTSGWYPDRQVRLYDRRRAGWNERKVHEYIETAEAPTLLNADLIHYSYRDLAEMKIRTTNYARLGAEVYKTYSVPVLLSKMIFSSAFKFFTSFILQRGFIDGYIGLMVCYYRSRETFLKYYWALI